jgi:hypothetical protein
MVSNCRYRFSIGIIDIIDTIDSVRISGPPGKSPGRRSQESFTIFVPADGLAALVIFVALLNK